MCTYIYAYNVCYLAMLHFYFIYICPVIGFFICWVINLYYYYFQTSHWTTVLTITRFTICETFSMLKLSTNYFLGLQFRITQKNILNAQGGFLNRGLISPLKLCVTWDAVYVKINKNFTDMNKLLKLKIWKSLTDSQMMNDKCAPSFNKFVIKFSLKNLYNPL